MKSALSIFISLCHFSVFRVLLCAPFNDWIFRSSFLLIFNQICNFLSSYLSAASLFVRILLFASFKIWIFRFSFLLIFNQICTFYLISVFQNSAFWILQHLLLNYCIEPRISVNLLDSLKCESPRKYFGRK